MDEISRVKNPTAQKEIYEQYSNGEITRNEIRNLKEPKKQKKYDDKVFEIINEKQKFVYVGVPSFDFCLEFKEIEASFYFSNHEKAVQFDLKKKYKITIEEIE